MDDYPNANPEEAQNWSVDMPQERKDIEVKENAKVSTSIGVIQDVLDWFDKQVELYATIDVLDLNEKTDPNAALVALNVAKRMKAAFESKSNAFRGEFSKYLKEDADEA